MQGQINNAQEQISTINASLQSLEQRVSALEQKQEQISTINASLQSLEQRVSALEQTTPTA